jgi:Zn-finger nucleic acid-binding protein
MSLQADRDSFTCEYCHSVYFPEKDDDGIRVLGEASDFSCPICDIPLAHAAMAQERIDYCTQCRGMFISMGKFLALVGELRSREGGEVSPTVPNPDELDRKISCPSCHQRMDTHLYGGPGNVVMDSCDRCEMNWFDHGELMRIASAPEGTHEAYFDEPGI